MANTVPSWNPLKVLRIPGPGGPPCQATQGCPVRLKRARYAEGRKQISGALDKNVNPFAIPEPALCQNLQSAAKLLLCIRHRFDQEALLLANRWIRNIVDWDCQEVSVDDNCPWDRHSLDKAQRVVKCGVCPKCIHAECITVWLEYDWVCPYW